MNRDKKTAAFMKVFNTIQSVTNILQFEACEKMIEIYTRFEVGLGTDCLLYTSPSPRDRQKSRMPSSA